MNMLKRRRNVISYLQKKIAKKYLKKSSRAHLAQRNQLVTFSFDFISQSIAINGRYEDQQLSLVEHLFSHKLQDKVVLDIGANIGNHTVAFSQMAKAVYAFEPNPVVFEVLKLNTKPFSNVHLFNLGASVETGSIQALIPKRNCGAGAVVSDRFVKKQDEDYINLTFDVVALDALDALAGEAVGLVKIDVEGHELQAFRGMQSLLSAQKPIILFEQNSGIENGSSQEIEFLKTLGYQYLYDLTPVDQWMTPTWLPSLLKSMMHVFEVMLLGEPVSQLQLTQITQLTKRRYDMLIFSADKLDTLGFAEPLRS